MRPGSLERGVRNAGGVLAALALACAPVCAQTHKVAKPENVVRAIGVYEWTGDMAKPTASRLIPVSLFIDGKLEDAAVYMARPVPLALLTGNVYQLDKAGVVLGTLNILVARHFVAAETAGVSYDDGWFGYGKFVPPGAAKKSTLKASATMAKINALDDEFDDQPHFSSRSAAPGSGGAATPTHGGTTSASSTPADDPDRPTLHRSGSGSDTSGSSGSTTAGSGRMPADDPDRPTLRRHSASDSKKSDGGGPSVTAVGDSLNDDPSRPRLHRGKPENELGEEALPKLTGLPRDLDLHQMVAVSDATDRPTHDFARPWEDEAEHQAILGKLENVARAQLAAYEAANHIAPTVPPAPAPPTLHKAGTASRRRGSVAKPVPIPPEPLLDEQLTGYTLSYGGAATYVYHAHTSGLGPALCYVTLVAQVNMQGEPEIAIKNVTDATHLDRTPRMRLVDAVDAEASNRASLLFELRAQNTRQFALYRVIGARAEQTFLTGSTQ
jgi:hypothetical protein